MNDSEIVRSLTTLSAVILGFILGQVSEWVKSRRKAKRQEKAIRRLIDLETGNNIAHIRSFWNAILARKKNWETEDGEFSYAQLADESSRVPFPPLTTDAWTANLAEIPAVYTQSELELLWRHQRDLEKIESLHQFFCEARMERRESSRFSEAVHGNSIMGTLIGGFGFFESVNQPAREFKRLVESVIDFLRINA